METTECKQCGGPARVKRDWQKFCSDGCRQKWNYLQRKRWQRLGRMAERRAAAGLVEKDTGK